MLVPTLLHLVTTVRLLQSHLYLFLFAIAASSKRGVSFHSPFRQSFIKSGGSDETAIVEGGSIPSGVFVTSLHQLSSLCAVGGLPYSWFNLLFIMRANAEGRGMEDRWCRRQLKTDWSDKGESGVLIVCSNPTYHRSCHLVALFCW